MFANNNLFAAIFPHVVIYPTVVLHCFSKKRKIYFSFKSLFSTSNELHDNCRHFSSSYLGPVQGTPSEQHEASSFTNRANKVS